MSADTITIHPDLCRLAIKSGDALCLRVWLVCRYLDTTGRGWVTRRELAARGLAILALAGRQLSNTIERGDGVWWEATDRGVYYYAMPRLSLALGCGAKHNHPMTIPLAVLKTLEVFKAHCYAAWLKLSEIDGETNPIANQTLDNLWGVSTRTRRRWGLKAGVQRRANFRFVEMAQTPRLDDHMPRAIFCSHCTFRAREGESDRILAHQHANCQGTLIVGQQRPNSYTIVNAGIGIGRWGAAGRRNRRKQRKLLSVRTHSLVTTTRQPALVGHRDVRNLRGKTRGRDLPAPYPPSTSVYLLSGVSDPVPGYLLERGRWWRQLA